MRRLPEVAESKMVAASSIPRPTPSEAILAPEDDERIALLVFKRIDDTISLSDREFLTYIDHVGRVLVERLENCDICIAHYVLYCDNAPPHVDPLNVAFFQAHGLVGYEHDEVQRLYLTRTPILRSFLHPPPPGRRRRRKK